MLYDDHLDLGLRHISAGRALIRRQIGVVRRLRALSLDTSVALELLSTLRRTLAIEREHLALIRQLRTEALQRRKQGAA